MFIWSADYFLSYSHPKEKHAWLSKNVGVALRLGAKLNHILEPSIPKMLQVGSLQPPGHDIGHSQ